MSPQHALICLPYRLASYYFSLFFIWYSDTFVFYLYSFGDDSRMLSVPIFDEMSWLDAEGACYFRLPL